MQLGQVQQLLWLLFIIFFSTTSFSCSIVISLIPPPNFSFSIRYNAYIHDVHDDDKDDDEDNNDDENEGAGGLEVRDDPDIEFLSPLDKRMVCSFHLFNNPDSHFFFLCSLQLGQVQQLLWLLFTKAV